jgi:hypothetical protein
VQLSPSALGAVGFVRPANPTPANTTIEKTAQLRVKDLASTDDPSTFSTSSAILVGRVNEPFAVAATSSATGSGSCSNKPTITYNSSGSFHGASPLRSIVLYEWQFIWDGNPATFSPAVVSPTAANVSFSDYPAPGTYPAGLRVTDNNVPAKTSFASLSVMITVASNAPVAVASPFVDGNGPFYAAVVGSPVTVDGSSSFDPDACYGDQVIQYLWDMNNNGVIDADALVNPTGVVETPVGQNARDVLTSSPTFQYRNLGWTSGVPQTIRLQVLSGNPTISGRSLKSAFSSAVIRIGAPGGP